MEQYHNTQLDSFHITLDWKTDSDSKVLSLHNQSISEVMLYNKSSPNIRSLTSMVLLVQVNSYCVTPSANADIASEILTPGQSSKKK